MRKFDSNLFLDYKNLIASHNLKSGEIIIEMCHFTEFINDRNKLIKDFLRISDIKIESGEYKVCEIAKIEAIESIKYGLSTKLNYTCIEKEFTESEKNRYTHEFIRFFDNPKFYSVDPRIYKEELELDDFWETGGAILIDDEKIGIIWVNDLYNKFE